MKNSPKNRLLKLAALAFIILLLVVANQENLRKTAAEKILNSGNYYFNGGAYDLAKAESRFKLALFFDSHLPWAHYLLGRVYFVENRLEEALKEIDTELALYPENKRSYYVRGLINGYSADFEAAIDDFSQFNAWAPREWAGYNDLAWSYYQNENYLEAKEAAEAGLKLFPNNAWLINGLGVSQLALEEFAASRETFNKLADLSNKLTVNDWIRAYPGNDPAEAEGKLDEFKNNVGLNLTLAQNDIAVGGFFADACASCAPTHYNCALGILGYAEEYADQWQWWCNGADGNGDVLCVEMKPVECGACGSCADSRYKWCTGGVYGSGQCTYFAECDCFPNNCADSICTTATCWNGCYTEQGKLNCCTPNCNTQSCADTCIGVPCTDSCGGTTCTGTKDCTSVPTLSVSLSANPNSGTAPLNGVDLSASVGGTATGNINYKFDCNNDGTWEYEYNGVYDNPRTVIDACNYSTDGNFTARVMVQRGTAPAAYDTETIAVSASGCSPNCNTTSCINICQGSPCTDSCGGNTICTGQKNCGGSVFWMEIVP